MEVACYARVSTTDQDLSRQIGSVLDFATDTLDADLKTEASHSIIADHIEDKAISPVTYGDVTIFFDKATGTNTDRNGHTELLTRVCEGDFDAVVVHSVSRLSRSIRDLDRIVDQIVEDNNTRLHIISEGFDFVPAEKDPYQMALFRVLGVFAELEAEMAQIRTKEGIATRMANEDYHHGPPPLGFDKTDGHLIEKAEFDRVRTVLEMVNAGELSKRKAARELDTSRRTIGRALERKELYGLGPESV